MNKWISVNEGMPQNNNFWYLIVNDGMVTMAFYEKSKHGTFWLSHNDNNNSDEWESVTHWMSLPEPPKE